MKKILRKIYQLMKLPWKLYQINGIFWNFWEHSKEVERDLRAIDERLKNLKTHTAFLTRSFETLESAIQTSGKKTVRAEELAKVPFPISSRIYYEFEKQFRGADEAILASQKFYLPFVKDAYQKSRGSYWVDLGCGRGEFLKLLADEGVPGVGVDNTAAMVESSRGEKIRVEQADAIEFLLTVPDQSLIGVSAFQVVEHLPPDYLVEFIKLAFTKIAPEGLIILETVNHGSVYSFVRFYLDLTHKNPVPWQTLKFLMDYAGFRDIDLKMLAPLPPELKLAGDDANTQKLNETLFGAQDYALLGRR